MPEFTKRTPLRGGGYSTSTSWRKNRSKANKSGSGGSMRSGAAAMFTNLLNLKIKKNNKRGG